MFDAEHHCQCFHPLVQNSESFPEGRCCRAEQEADFSVLDPHGEETCPEIETSPLNPV